MDQVIVVDKLDHVLGVMDKIEAHTGEGVLHRASSVFLFNHVGQLLIQQRSEAKIVGALQWANTCCGNVRPGESYEECAQRRLEEELGIENVELKQVEKFTYRAKCNEQFSEYEMDTVFAGKYDGKVQPNSNEVKNYRWINWGEFEKSVVSAEETEGFLLAPWVKIMGEKGIIQKLGELYVR